MTVNMGGIDKNPFRVGDKVRIKAHILRTWPIAFKRYLGIEYAVVQRVDNCQVMTDVDRDPAHFEHFELYKESGETMNQQTHQKTKRVPFTKELWKRNQTAKVIWTPTETEILYFDKWGGCGYDFIGVYKAPREEYAATTFQNADFPNMAIEIPLTTKRIPFNPELKDAKVFYGKTELIEWVRMSSGVVCGVHEQLSPFKSLETALYHPNHLEMEIEEDV